MLTYRFYKGMTCIVLLAVLFDAGCWGKKFFRAPRETIETSSKVDSLLSENMKLQRRLYWIEKSLNEQQEYTRGVNAQNKIDIEELKDQMNALLELLEQGGQLAVPEKVPANSQTGIGADREAVQVSSPDSAGATVDEMSSVADSAGAVPAAGPPSPEEIFRQVYLDFSRMEYQIALDESVLFLEEYGGHPLEQEVRYIRGECFMEQEKYFDALKEFSSILQGYPRGQKVPAALLRMAISYDKIGDRDLAAGVVRRLVREYPASEEAEAARQNFSEMLGD